MQKAKSIFCAVLGLYLLGTGIYCGAIQHSYAEACYYLLMGKYTFEISDFY